MLRKLQIAALAAATLAPLALAACDNGPAQRAGRDVDRVTGQEGLITKGPGEKAGQDVDRTLGTNR
jgi:hypothetical protein